MSIKFPRWSGMSGLVCVEVDKDNHYLTLQLFIRPKKWLFGRDEVWYDGLHRSFGLGPFALISWS